MKQKRGASPAASKKAGGEKITHSMLEFLPESRHPVEPIKLQHKDEISLSANAGKPEKIDRMPHAEKKAAYASMWC